MDVSKLPRLSETKPGEPAPAPANAPVSPASAASSRPIDYRGDGGGGGAIIGAEIWFSVIIGLILVLYTGQVGKYIIATATGQPFHTNVNWTTGPNEGTEVPYPQLEGGTFYADSSLFFFGLAMLIGAAAQLAAAMLHRRGIAWISLICVLLATVYCLVAVVIVYQQGTLPLMSLLCVGLGGYAMIYEYAALKRGQ